jgi:hypothetical protein
MKNIVCFETVRPNKIFFDLCSQIKNDNYKIFIFIDDNNYNIDFDYDTDLTIVKIDNDECKNAGYFGFVSYFKDKSCSKDKALYYIVKNREILEFDHVWFIEEDCFIPSKNTLLTIDNKYENEDIDFLCKGGLIINVRKPIGWPHWKFVFNNTKLPPPYGRSLICARRCSRKLINVIDDYVQEYKKIFYCEAFYNTLSLHYKLKCKEITELSTLIWKSTHIWKYNDIKEDYIYHPIKDINIQSQYRKKFMN